MRRIFFILVFFLFAKNVFAAPFINEIYPVPSAGDQEWVEIYNNDATPLYIYNYILQDLVGNKIKLATDTIGAFSFALATSSSVLNNSGDTVFLINDLNQVVNIASYSGTLSSSQSIGRCPDGGDSWLTTTVITKNSSNVPACFALTPTPTSPPHSTTTPTVEASTTPTPTYHENIFLSEVMVNPKPGEKEWIEIYNDNEFSVTLIDWYIDDVENAGSTPKRFSLEIPPYSYRSYILGSPVFNNDKDSVRLLDQNKVLKDDFEYFTSVVGQTYGRAVGGVDFCLQESSFEATNNSCLTPLVLVAANPSPTITPIKKAAAPTKSSVLTVKPIKLTSKKEGAPTRHLEVLGVTDEKSPDPVVVTRLSFLSFSYSLLTILAILFKMKFKYGRPKKILFSFFHPPRGE